MTLPVRPRANRVVGGLSRTAFGATRRSAPTSSEAMVGSPRGRRFLAAAAEACSPGLRTAVNAAAGRPAGGSEVAAAVELIDAINAARIESMSESDLVGHLSSAVRGANYRTGPDPQEGVYGLDSVRPSLRRLAAALVRAPAAGWWSEPVDLATQRHVQWFDRRWFERPRSAGIAGLIHWHAATSAEEARAHRDRPGNVLAHYSGTWWSTPAPAGSISTTRPAAGLRATNLALTEDGLGWDRARVWPVQIRGRQRIYEITGPDDWAALVDAYPMRVTASRRHDWYRTTARDGEWFIPDWAAVADDFDAVHLTVHGYLSTPGVAIDVAGGATVLAGWNPDETYWLTGVGVVLSDEPEEWISEAVRDSPTGRSRAGLGAAAVEHCPRVSTDPPPAPWR